MDHSVNLAQHFARLVWLLLHEPGNVDEQKAALRALVVVAKDGRVALALVGETIEANGAAVPTDFPGLSDLATQMASHGLAAVTVDRDAAAKDLLGVSRILAGMPVLGDQGASAETKRIALGATTVRFAARPTAAIPIVQSSIAPASSASAAMPDLDFGEVFDDPLAEARSLATPRSSPTVQAGSSPDSHGEGAGGLFAQFATARHPKGSYELLLTRLEATTDAGHTAAILEDLVVIAENSAREAKPDVVGDIMTRVMRREAQLQDPDTKHAFVMAQRRMAKPVSLRAISVQLPHRPERLEDYIAVLARAGEEGADALIEQMSTVTHATDRRVYYDVLLRLKAGIPTLVHMLGDTRWFIARNAADLLGEMQARESEQPLTELLRHDDDRVRRSARGALMRLGTPRAMQSIEDALKDHVPQMRIEAAAALVTRKDSKAAGTLLRALELEKDEEVQAAYLHALGKIATPEAVQRLIRAAQGERGLFKKRATAFRLAAIHGLAEARTTDATDALKELKTDKEQEVRDAAVFALGRISRSTRSIERPVLPPE